MPKLHEKVLRRLAKADGERLGKLSEMLERFQEFYGGLSDNDRNNFDALVNLPNATDILARCPDREWQEMGTMVLVVNRAKKVGLGIIDRPDSNQDKAEKVKHVKASGQERDHVCHWPGCGKQCPPAKWGCYKCWMKLPKRIRDRIWVAYRIGQERTRLVSREYVEAACASQEWIRANHGIEE